MIMNTSATWARYTFYVPGQSNSYYATILFQGVLQSCQLSKECRLELDCIHAYRFLTNSSSKNATSYTNGPTSSPTLSQKPSLLPTKKPSNLPSLIPSRPSIPPTTREPIHHPFPHLRFGVSSQNENDSPTRIESKPTMKPRQNPIPFPIRISSTVKPTMKPTRNLIFSPTRISSTVKPTMKPTRKFIFSPTRITSTAKPTMKPTRNPITSITSTSKGCTTVIDFSGSATSNIVTSTSNCVTMHFPATVTPIDISVCGYSSSSPSSPDYLWQVGYFNTLYPGGLGLDSCPYHDICPGYMIQINLSGILNLDNPQFSMISTPISLNNVVGNYSIYGSNTAGIRGNDLLFSEQTLNRWLPLPISQQFTFLSFVSISQFPDPSGILLQKLKGTATCMPSSAPSPLPSSLPSFKPLTLKPSTPTRSPTSRPTRKPTSIPSSPTSKPSIVPSAPTFTPTTQELKSFIDLSGVTYSSRPVLMHQFQFKGSFYAYVSASCNKYIVDKIQNSTASICNNVQISDNEAIFKSAYPPVPYIQINNIVELSNVNVFSIATWITLGETTYDGGYPLFSFGDISFPFLSNAKVSLASTSVSYDLLGCYSIEFAKKTSTVVKSRSFPNSTLSECQAYATDNNFDYFLFGKSFCR